MWNPSYWVWETTILQQNLTRRQFSIFNCPLKVSEIWNLKCTLLSKLNLLRSLDSVALLSPWVSAPYQNTKSPIKAQKTGIMHHPLHTTTQQLTKLSSLLATIDANLCSPANSEIRKTYSGAVTWFDLWVRPVTTLKKNQPVFTRILRPTPRI